MDRPPQSKFGARQLLTVIVLSVITTLALYAAVGGFSESGGVSYTFLFVLPVILTFAAMIGLSLQSRESAVKVVFYPALALCGITFLTALILREAAVCIIMLLVPWLMLSLLTASIVFVTRRIWRVSDKDIFYSSGILVIPFLFAYLEMQIEPPMAEKTVENSIIIDAPREKIWPRLLKLNDIRPSEGTKNFTQEALNIPRPTSAIVAGEGIGAVRYAQWGPHVHFQERIFEWREGRKLSWNFEFADDSVQQNTDRHISPTGPHSYVDKGGYILTPHGRNGTKLTLWTTYRVKTHMNSYAALWGTFLLNDIQNNILHIVKVRSETDQSL